MLEQIHDQNKSFNTAINYTINTARENSYSDAILFLEMWREGNWDEIKKNFPDFDISSIPKEDKYNKKKNIQSFFELIDGEIIQDTHYKLSVFHFEKLAYLIHKRMDISILNKLIIDEIPIEAGRYLGEAREIALWRSKSSAENVKWSSKDDYLIFDIQNLMELD